MTMKETISIAIWKVGMVKEGAGGLCTQFSVAKGVRVTAGFGPVCVWLFFFAALCFYVFRIS